MDLSRDDILAILEALDNASFTHFELRVGDTVIIAGISPDRIIAGTSPDGERPASPQTGDSVPPNPAGVPGDPTTASVTNAVPPLEHHLATGPLVLPDLANSDSDLVDVVAPIVGAFYSGPEPGAPPFVDVGSQITVGQTLALLEVMKMFNAVTADVAGTVTEVLVKDGEFVEFGQPLMRVRATAS